MEPANYREHAAEINAARADVHAQLQSGRRGGHRTRKWMLLQARMRMSLVVRSHGLGQRTAQQISSSKVLIM